MLKNCLFYLLLFPLFLLAQTFPLQPSNYVTDEADILTNNEIAELNKLLKDYEDSTSNQLFVYISKSLSGEDMQSLCQNIFHTWGIGQTNNNNGVLVAIFIDDHKFRIHTGYGMEGSLPDLLTKRIQDELMRPEFRAGNYYQGISIGVEKLIYYSTHEYVPEEVDYSENSWISWLIGYSGNVILLLIYIITSLNSKTKKRKALWISIAFLVAFFPCIGAIIIFFMLVLGTKTTYSGKRKGRNGNYKSSTTTSFWSSSDSDSSWSSSDSSSSDFGGGGGGDSGGGGSSSDW